MTRVLDAQQLAKSLNYGELVSALETAFKLGATVPSRHHHTIDVSGGSDATLLLMPAWNEMYLGIKTATVMPGNNALNLPSVHANYQLMDLKTGTLLAILDGAELTARRTAAASALASRYLSRTDSSSMLMVGTGILAPHLIRAHASQREIKAVKIWGRRLEKAASVAAAIDLPGVAVEAVSDLEAAVVDVDIISCATLANAPLIHGKWLRAGQHLDLVGGFTRDMRETDDEAIIRSRVFVDTNDAIETTGDIFDPLRRGVIGTKDILGNLFTLTQGKVPPARKMDADITFFKSAGTAIEDLAGAILAYQRASV